MTRQVGKGDDPYLESNAAKENAQTAKRRAEERSKWPKGARVDAAELDRWRASNLARREATDAIWHRAVKQWGKEVRQGVALPSTLIITPVTPVEDGGDACHLFLDFGEE